MCLHNSPGNNKSRHLKQVTASLKSNILLCLESKGFEFLSAIHLSLMKHLLQFDLFQYDFSVWKRMKKSDWKPQNPWSYGAFPVCRNYTVRAYIRYSCHWERNAAQSPAKAAGSCQYHDHYEPLCSCNRRFHEEGRSTVRKGTGSTKRVSKRWVNPICPPNAKFSFRKKQPISVQYSCLSSTS